MKDTLGLDFITRTLKTTGVLLLIAFPFGLYYYGLYPTLAVLSGGVWGLLNLMLIKTLVVAVIRPGGADWSRAALVMLFLFPVLFVAGYFLLTVENFTPLHLLIGFSAPLLVMVLKVLGRLLVGNSRKQNSETLQGAL